MKQNVTLIEDIRGMKHIIIFSLGLNLIAGTGVFLYAYQVYRKYYHDYLKALLYYILFFNVMIFVAFIHEYLLINLYNSDYTNMLQDPVLQLLALLIFVVFAAEFGITHCVYRIAAYLKGKALTRRIKVFFIVWLTGFAAASLYGMFVTYQKSAVEPFYWIHAGWIFSMDVIILSVLISTLVFWHRNRTTEHSIRSFAYIFLAGYAAFTFSQLDFYFFHAGIEKNFDPLILLLINFCPFFWLKFYYTKQNLTPSTMEKMETLLNNLCSKYHISKREKEIIELILAGKSNKEIEDALFISFNTVKNHIYNIYQKVGVQSRSQLIHHINRHTIDEI